MKLPKKTKRYCKHCKKKTDQKMSLVSTGTKRGALKRGALKRAKKRGLARGKGNLGRWGSKPAATKWKRKTKSTKRLVVMYTCLICKKSKQAKNSRRVNKILFEEKK